MSIRDRTVHKMTDQPILALANTLIRHLKTDRSDNNRKDHLNGIKLQVWSLA